MPTPLRLNVLTPVWSERFLCRFTLKLPSPASIPHLGEGKKTNNGRKATPRLYDGKVLVDDEIRAPLVSFLKKALVELLREKLRLPSRAKRNFSEIVKYRRPKIPAEMEDELFLKTILQLISAFELV